MQKRVYITEKPQVAKALAEHIGLPPSGRKKGYYVTANGDEVVYQFGHMVQNAEPDYYITDPEKKGRFNPKSLPNIPTKFVKVPAGSSKKELSKADKDKIAQLKIIVDRLKTADIIVNAGDTDREGQIIADELIQYAGFDPDGTAKMPVERLCIRALDSRSLDKLFKSPKQYNREPQFRNLRFAGEARQNADWLIGMNYSKSYTIAANSVVNIGRVRTPVVNIVYEREIEIENFVSHDFYVPSVNIVGRGKFTWKTRIGAEKGKLPFDQELRIVDVEAAKEIVIRAKAKGLTVTRADSENKSKSPPLPYNLSALQAEVARSLRIKVKEATEVIQGLYQNHKLITYVGTDSRYLPEDQFFEAPNIVPGVVASLGLSLPNLDLNKKSPCWNDKGVSAHHAIIPTFKAADLNALTPVEKAVYSIIARRYLSQFMPDYVYRSMIVEATCDSDLFVQSGTETVNPGWHLTEGSTPAKGVDEVETDPAEARRKANAEAMKRGDAQ